MAVTWGAYVSKMRVGIDVRTSAGPSVDIYVDVYVQCEPGWNFSDNQHVALRGSSSADWDFTNTLGSGQTRLMGTLVIANQNQSIGGGPTYSWTATLTGNYLGGSSSHSRSYTLPALPVSVPAPPSPGPAWSAVTATTATVDWGNSPDTNGAPVVETWLQVSLNNGFTDLFFNGSTGTATVRALTDLVPGKSYWARARARNSAGWSGWSAVVGATMAPFATGAPSVNELGADAATVFWAAPSGGTPTRYEVQVARDSGFTNSLQTISSTTWATSRRVGSLVPGTAYFARVRSGTSTGWGAWSPATAFSTTSFGTAAPTFTEVGPDAATVNWSTPMGAAPTGYELQVARDAAFTASLQTFTSPTWGTSYRLTGLAPASRYFVRVRTKASTGYGSWSPGVALDTLSGAKVRVAGVWRDAPAYVRVGGAWKPAKVYKRVNGVWRL